jgi:hypothetical protein
LTPIFLINSLLLLYYRSKFPGGIPETVYLTPLITTALEIQPAPRTQKSPAFPFRTTGPQSSHCPHTRPPKKPAHENYAACQTWAAYGAHLHHPSAIRIHHNIMPSGVSNTPPKVKTTVRYCKTFFLSLGLVDKTFHSHTMNTMKLKRNHDSRGGDERGNSQKRHVSRDDAATQRKALKP